MPREGGEDQMSAVCATLEEVELARRGRVVRALLEWPPTLTVWWSAGGRVRAFELADPLGEASYELVETHDASGRLEQCGWRQRARLHAADEAAGRMVSAAEPYAELTPHGREQWVIEATESLADEVAGAGARRGTGALGGVAVSGIDEATAVTAAYLRDVLTRLEEMTRFTDEEGHEHVVMRGVSPNGRLIVFDEVAERPPQCLGVLSTA